MTQDEVLARLYLLRETVWGKMNGTARYMLTLCIRSMEKELHIAS